jgi:Glycosyltransferases involved in cell wall biogenesis
MKENIKVSIITPSFNQGQFIEFTIKSVLNQTYKNIEFIVVDGGSSDNTPEIINKYRDRIDIVISEKDKGQSDAINKGFRLSTGTLVGWINSDDILYPECVENLVKAYCNFPGASVYYCPRLDAIDKEGNVLYTNQRNIIGKKYLLTTCYDVNQPTSFYNNELLRQIDYLDETIYYCMDLDLWLRLLDRAPICPISDEPQGAIRKWEATKTATGASLFLKDIRSILLRNGASYFSRTVLDTYYGQFKCGVKNVLKKSGLR